MRPVRRELAVAAYLPAGACILAWLLPATLRTSVLGSVTVGLLAAAIAGLVAAVAALWRRERPLWLFAVAAAVNVMLAVLLGGTLVFIGNPA